MNQPWFPHIGAVSLLGGIVVCILAGASGLFAEAGAVRMLLPESGYVTALHTDSTELHFKQGRSSIRVYVHGKDGELLSNAAVTATSMHGDSVIPLQFDTVSRCYRFRNTWTRDFRYQSESETGEAPDRYRKLTIISGGYQSHEYYLNEHCDAQSGRIDIYLAQPNERLYYDGCRGIPFVPRRDVLYVEFVSSDRQRRKLNDALLKRFGLKVVQSYSRVSRSDSRKRRQTRRHRSGSESKEIVAVVIRRNDGKFFERMGDTILAALRQDTLIRVAGPIRYFDNNRAEAYDNTLIMQFGAVEDPVLQNDYETVTNLLWGMGATDLKAVPRYGYTSGTWRIIARFENGMGEGILDMVDTLRATGLFNFIQNTEVGYTGYLPGDSESKAPKGPMSSSSARSRAARVTTTGADERMLKVRVVGDSGETLYDIRIAAYRWPAEPSLSIRYDSSGGIYLIPFQDTKLGWISASSPGRMTQVRPLSDSVLSELSDGILTLRLYSIRREYIWTEVGKFLYTSRPDWVGLTYKKEQLAKVLTLLRKLDLRVVGDLELQRSARLEGYTLGDPDPFHGYGPESMKPIRDLGVLVVARNNGEPFHRYSSAEIEALRSDTNITFVGPTIRLTNVYIDAYGDKVFVQFDRTMSEFEVEKAVEPYGFTVEPRNGSHTSRNQYTLKAAPGMGEGLWEAIDRIMLLDGVSHVSNTYLEVYDIYEHE